VRSGPEEDAAVGGADPHVSAGVEEVRRQTGGVRAHHEGEVVGHEIKLTTDAQRAQRSQEEKSLISSCLLCALCASVVNSYLRVPCAAVLRLEERRQIAVDLQETVRRNADTVIFHRQDFLLFQIAKAVGELGQDIRGELSPE